MEKKNLLLGEVWDEWLSSEIKNAEYEVSGILTGMKNLSTARLKVARRLMKIWPFTSYAENFSPGISMITRKNYRPSVKFTFPLKPSKMKILKSPRTLRNSWAWLKGLWGSSGGLYFPKNGYYLTLIISDGEVSENVRKVLAMTGLSWSEHRSEFTLRNHEDIMTFLCNAGMPSSALNFDETVLIRLVRNSANLRSNYETANIARTVKAAARQLEIAKRISAEGILERLPKNLRDVIECRIKNPEYSLDELGQNLMPPISKSAVKYRWLKIQKYIDEKN